MILPAFFQQVAFYNHEGLEKREVKKDMSVLTFMYFFSSW